MHVNGANLENGPGLTRKDSSGLKHFVGVVYFPLNVLYIFQLTRSRRVPSCNSYMQQLMLHIRVSSKKSSTLEVLGGIDM